MRYYALATDYDDTLALHGRVEEATFTSLRSIKETGRKLLLVTGRELPELLPLLPDAQLFDRIVAENGGVLHDPKTSETRALARRPPAELVDALRARNVEPLSIGQVIVATREPHEAVVLDTIRQLGLEYQVIFNKGAVMVLPSGVNKATGLKAALKELELSSHNVAAVGDAENDHAFLDYCGLGAAVANALPALKQRADVVLAGERGIGVAELANRITSRENELNPRGERSSIALGMLSRPGEATPKGQASLRSPNRDASAGGAEVQGSEGNGQFLLVPGFGTTVLLAGTSGGGKSTLVTGFLERLMEKCYQACVIDPEGDYPELEEALVLGDGERMPGSPEVIKSLSGPDRSVVVNFMAAPLPDRPRHFQTMLSGLLEMRSQTGRPHWIIADETHHLMPASWKPSDQVVPSQLKGLFLITVQPQHISRTLLEQVDLVVALGREPGRTFREFADAVGRAAPKVPEEALGPGEAFAWWVGSAGAPVLFQAIPAKTIRRRHIRKYMDGELIPEECFLFEGPEGKLRLRAQNLAIFMQMADGVDDDTWEFHLRRGDYSKWFRTVIKDDELAGEAEGIEQDSLSAADSRKAIRAAIEQRYTAAE